MNEMQAIPAPKAVRGLAAAALAAGAAMFAVALVRSYLNVNHLMEGAGIAVTAALILRWTAAPRQGPWRAAAIALIAAFALMPALMTLRMLIGIVHSLSLSEHRGLGSMLRLLIRDQVQGVRYLLTSALLYLSMTAIGILMLLRRPGPARTLAFIAMALAALDHLIPAIRAVADSFALPELRGSSLIISMLWSLLTFAAELLLLLALRGVLFRPRTPEPPPQA